LERIAALPPQQVVRHVDGEVAQPLPRRELADHLSVVGDVAAGADALQDVDVDPRAAALAVEEEERVELDLDGAIELVDEVGGAELRRGRLHPLDLGPGASARRMPTT
jgi:hypothetical protein